jgi:hypothetical protein
MPTLEQVKAKQKELKELVKQQDQIIIDYSFHLESFREQCEKKGMTGEDARIAVQAVDNLVKIYIDQTDSTNKSDADRENEAKDGLKNCEVMTAITTPVLEKILSEGRFKSQFETGTSGGYLGSEVRSRQETTSFAYHPSMNPTMRPIYGYIRKGYSSYSRVMSEVRQYGYVHVVFKNEIKDRTTFTTDDSLNSSMIPAPVNKPNKMAAKPRGNWTLYTEAQIHGGLSVKDIAKIVIHEDQYSVGAVKKLLKGTGIPLEIITDPVYKASFGGDRSAAGRYAAQQRWKGHVKDQPQSPVDRIKSESARVAGLLKQMDEAVGGDGKAPQLPTMTVFGTMWTEDDLLGLFESWDTQEGYKLTKMRLPVQRKENGELKTGETWDRKEYYEHQEINMPSPAVFEVEQQVNALGREVLATAESNLEAQGITRASVDKAAKDRDNAINEANQRFQEVSSLLSYEGRYKENTTGIEVPKELEELANLRTRYAEDYIAISNFGDREATDKAGENLMAVKKQLQTAMDNWQPYKDARDAHDRAIRLPKVAPYQTQIYNEVQTMLRKVRQMHTVEIDATPASSDHEDITNRFKNNVEAVFPSDIIKKVNTNMGIIKVSQSGGGGSWSYNRKTVTTDPINEYVDMHEFIHAWSDSSTQVRYVESALLARRIVGLRSEIGKTPMSAKKMAQGVQPIFQQKTYTNKSGMKYALKFPHVRDEFNDPYAGRLYSTGGAEVLTVGHDYAFTSQRMRSVTKKPFDTDLSATVIGLMFTADLP